MKGKGPAVDTFPCFTPLSTISIHAGSTTSSGSKIAPPWNVGKTSGKPPPRLGH